EGHFGFHHFGNFEKILPELQEPGEEKYFEVGNLKPDTYPGSRDLPDYVRGDYDGTWRNGEHNKDRVIVRLKGRNVVREVYITEHSLRRAEGVVVRASRSQTRPEAPRGNMVLLCDPREGHFGFHHFGNFEKILPELQEPGEEKYFEVGNLKPDTYPGSRDLPDYVRGDYDGTWRNGEHNKDRVIVRLKGRNVVTEVYVTEHEASSNNFDPKRTHLVTPDTVRLIREPHLELEDFLYKTGYSSKLRYCLFKCLRCLH
ncbi:hypothetical protein Z043_125883, partial [Scleropages formosus]